MKIQIRFKTPDVVRDSLDELDLQEDDRDAVEEKVNAWFRHGEYVDLEYDTDTDTMTVLKPPKERY